MVADLPANAGEICFYRDGLNGGRRFIPRTVGQGIRETENGRPCHFVEPANDRQSQFSLTTTPEFHKLSPVKHLQIRSASEQLADYLKEEIRHRRWTGTMPGESWLAENLGLGRDTVRAAMTNLEKEGVVVCQGQGQRRRIVMKAREFAKHYLVTMLVYSPPDRKEKEVQDIMLKIIQRGYQVELAPKTLVELGMKAERVAQMAEKVATDAWVVTSASSEVLEWFAGRSAPAFALYGGFSGVPVAGIGPDKFPAYRKALRRLVELGHRRIVLLIPEQMRKPKLALTVRRILDEMETQGISPNAYHIPDWERGPEGLRRCLDRLFGLTPPTALFVEEACEFFAVQQYLAKRGIFAPKDISLICSDDNPFFQWCDSSVSCIRWSTRPVVNRVVRWVENIAHGKDDRRKSHSSAEFVEGGTIGPVPKAR